MTYTRISLFAFIFAVSVISCKKTENGTNKDSVAVVVPAKDTLKDQAAQWAAFKADANQKIQALQDSMDAYDARMKAANPHYKADMKRRAEIKARAAALKAQLAEPKDEAVGSFGRMKDAIVGGLDTLTTGVSNIVSPSKKK
jgi:hypothetical protein